MSESQETEAEAVDAREEGPWNADMPNPSSIDAAVSRLLKALGGFSAKFNKKQSLSVVDLKHRAEPQGTRFRQIWVKQNPGTIVVSLVESFKAVHGGNEQRKVLFTFTVSVTDGEAFKRLENRFFGYSAGKNATEAGFLLEELERTVISS